MMKKADVLNFIIVMTAFLGPCLKSSAAGLTTRLNLQGETLNFEMAGQKSWDYDISRFNDKKNTKVYLKVKGTTKEALAKIQFPTNPFVTSVKVLPETIDDVQTIEFVLKNNQVEAFDYLTDQPSKLIVDFYFNEDYKAEPLTNEIKVKNFKKPSTKPVAQEDRAKKTVERKPADVDYLRISNLDGVETSIDNTADLKSGLFDGGDNQFKRFRISNFEVNQSAILKGLTNYYLNFPMVDQEFSFWKKMKQNPPEYQIKPNESDDNKQARLLLTLFKKERFLVLKKTFDWFEEKYPNSEYLETAYFMMADALIQMWRNENKNEYFEAATHLYSRAIEKYPQSALAERTSLLLGFLNIDKKNYLEASRKFNTHINTEKFKNKISRQYADLGLAYSLSKLSQIDQAVQLAQKIENESTDQLVKAEAAFRRADIYMSNEKYQLAHDEYFAAIQKYDKLTALFPSAFYNKMEALFRLQKPIQAHQAALNFVQNFPSHDFAPYALTRVGELLEIIGVDTQKSTGAYLETHFRYGDNPKTIIARLHLLSTRMKGMKPLELDQTILKMDELASKSDLDNVDQFKATMISDGYARRDNYDKAIEILSQFYQASPNRKNSDQVTKRIIKNIHDQVRYFSENKEPKKVLQTVQKYSDTWLKRQDRMDTNFFVGNAYKSAGAFSVALKKYDKVLESLKNLDKNPEAANIKATQFIPLQAQINLAKAQCLFNESQYQAAFDEIQSIQKPEELSENDQIERVFLASQIFEKKTDYKSAIRYLNEIVTTWKNSPQAVASSAIKLAELDYKNGSLNKAQEGLKDILGKNILAADQVKGYKMLAEISEKKDDRADAIVALSKLIDKFDNEQELSQERFKLGQLYFENGDLKKAEEAWSGFNIKEGSFWKKLAQERMSSEKWKSEYKKYLKRIPATANSSVGELQ